MSEEILPDSWYTLQGSTLVEILDKIKNNKFYIYKKVNGKVVNESSKGAWIEYLYNDGKTYEQDFAKDEIGDYDSKLAVNMTLDQIRSEKPKRVESHNVVIDAGMKDKIEMIYLIQGKGDGKMNCFMCGVRMTIVEVAKNRYEGATMNKGYEVVAWCNECVPVGVKE